MDERLTLLRELCALFGPSGCEGNVCDYIRSALDGRADELYTMRDGTLVAAIHGDGSTSKRVMLDAHMDEVGFMVTHIDDEGYIRFTLLGRIDARVICGRKVIFGDENKKIIGIVASKAIHQQSDGERRNPTPVEKMYIDIGAKNREETMKYVEPGDFGTFEGDFVLFGNKLLRSAALDDRFGCAVLINVLNRLKDEADNGSRLPFDTYFAFTTREEVGKSGSQTASYKIRPDTGIVLECTAVDDVPGTADEYRVGTTGEGGLISLIDTGTVYDSGLARLALDVGAEKNIKCQIKRYPGGSNNSAYIQKTAAGARVITISAPGRSIHSPSTVINTDDYYAIEELVFALLHEPGIV